MYMGEDKAFLFSHWPKNSKLGVSKQSAYIICNFLFLLHGTCAIWLVKELLLFALHAFKWAVLIQRHPQSQDQPMAGSQLALHKDKRR